jgi:Zn-dependent peptidase ImmA (M78 family)
MIVLSQAVKAALECRLRCGIPLDGPCDVYELIAQHGIELRFMEVTSLEGLYLVDGNAAQINVCGNRPSGLQKFIAAHELGHHIFGHGATIDQESDYHAKFSSYPEEEKLVEVFARFLLMPPRAVRKGFNSIGSVLGYLQPDDVFRVSCWLGVGYSTLLNQMCFSLHMLPKGDLEKLSKVKPQQIKTTLEPNHGHYGRDELWPAHNSWQGMTVHARIGDVLTGVAGCNSDSLAQIGKFTYRASAVGETSCSLKGGGILNVRVARNPYIGLYKYRYLLEVE